MSQEEARLERGSDRDLSCALDDKDFRLDDKDFRLDDKDFALDDKDFRRQRL